MDGRMRTFSDIPNWPKRAAPKRAEKPDTAQSPTIARVVVVSDVRLHGEGLTFCLSHHDRVEVVGVASSLNSALIIIAEYHPDVVLLDMVTHASLAISRAIIAASPLTKIVAFAVDEIERDVQACAEAGITNYVSRDGSADDIVAAVHHALCGELHCSPRMAAFLFHQLANVSRHQVGSGFLTDLTRREFEIVSLLERGLSNKEIARQLQIGVATAKNHVHNILDKLRVHRRGEAAARFRATVHNT
jgi:two-component system nitrate/nitrite response regulator NarL